MVSAERMPEEDVHEEKTTVESVHEKEISVGPPRAIMPVVIKKTVGIKN